MTQLIEYRLYFENMLWAASHVVDIDTIQRLEKFKAIVEEYDKHFAPVNYPWALDQFLSAYSKRLAELREVAT